MYIYSYAYYIYIYLLTEQKLNEEERERGGDKETILHEEELDVKILFNFALSVQFLRLVKQLNFRPVIDLVAVSKITSLRSQYFSNMRHA